MVLVRCMKPIFYRSGPQKNVVRSLLNCVRCCLLRAKKNARRRRRRRRRRKKIEELEAQLVGKEWNWYICSDLDTVDSQKWHGFFLSSLLISFIRLSFHACIMAQTKHWSLHRESNWIAWLFESVALVSTVWLCGSNKLDGPKSTFVPFVYMVISDK